MASWIRGAVRPPVMAYGRTSEPRLDGTRGSSAPVPPLPAALSIVTVTPITGLGGLQLGADAPG